MTDFSLYWYTYLGDDENTVEGSFGTFDEWYNLYR